MPKDNIIEFPNRFQGREPNRKQILQNRLKELQVENEYLNQDMDFISEQMSVKSIIGKLSREGVYQKQVYTTKTGEIPVTKEFLILGLADLFEVDSSKLMGLEKAPKQVIKFLHDTIGETNG